MNDALQLMRDADPAVQLDRDPDSPPAHAIYLEALDRAERTPTPRRKPRPARRMVALTAAIALVGIALAIVPDLVSKGPKAYAIKQLSNGVIVVDWSADSFAPNADAIASDLRGYGVDVQITTIPASPSAVGQVTATFPGEGNGPPPPGLTIGDAGTPGAFTWRIDPLVFHGPVALQVAVPPQDGQRYQISEEVFEPGEMLSGLQCALGEPLRASDVAARLPGLGLTAEWSVIDPASITPDGYHETPVDHVPDGVILWGYANDAHTVRFTVAPDGTPLERFPPAHLSDFPCTPQQAARWR